MTTQHHTPPHQAERTIEPLTPEGLARKQAMLAQLESAVRGRGRRRVAIRAGAAVAATAVIVTGVLASNTLTRSSPEPVSDPVPAVAHAEPTIDAPTPHLPARVVYVADDGSVLDRLTVVTTGSTVQRLSDDQLLAELREIGMPAGLVRTEGRVRLAFYSAAAADPNRTP